MAVFWKSVPFLCIHQSCGFKPHNVVIAILWQDVKRCHPYPPAALQANLDVWHLDIDLLISSLLVSSLPAMLAQVAQGIYRSMINWYSCHRMSNQMQSSPWAPSSETIPRMKMDLTNEAWHIWWPKFLNVACLLFLTQKWVLFDSLPFRYAGYVGSVLARCSRCTFRSESVPTEYIPPLLFGAHSASCLSKGLAPNRKSPPVVTPV